MKNIFSNTAQVSCVTSNAEKVKKVFYNGIQVFSAEQTLSNASYSAFSNDLPIEEILEGHCEGPNDISCANSKTSVIYITAKKLCENGSTEYFDANDYFMQIFPTELSFTFENPFIYPEEYKSASHTWVEGYCNGHICTFVKTLSLSTDLIPTSCVRVGWVDYTIDNRKTKCPNNSSSYPNRCYCLKPPTVYTSDSFSVPFYVCSEHEAALKKCRYDYDFQISAPKGMYKNGDLIPVRYVINCIVADNFSLSLRGCPINNGDTNTPYWTFHMFKDSDGCIKHTSKTTDSNFNALGQYVLYCSKDTII